MQLINCVDILFVKKRLENSNIINEDPYKLYWTNSFLYIYWFYNKSDSLIYQKSNISIVFYDLIFSQKGLNHIFNKPVNGQRTWSNSKTPKKLNTFLINFKINLYKERFTGPVNKNNLKYLIYLNYYNWIWKVFWIRDWVFLYKKNKNLLVKNQFSKKRALTLHKLLNYRGLSKRAKSKNTINFKNIFDFIGLDDLISLYKKK